MELMTLILLTLVVISISMLLWKQMRKPRMKGPHPLGPYTDSPKSTADRYIYEWKVRKKLLRNPFNTQAALEGGPYDAIIIGSGMGGLTVAVLLSKMGKKVLVLEQNSQLGGCCHTFSSRGYEFDVGIHYIGKMFKGHYDRYMIDQLTDGQLEWAEMEKQFDTVVLGGSNIDSDPEFIPIGKSLDDSAASIAKHFPEEKAAVYEFFRTVKKKSNEFTQFVIIKFLPSWLVRFLGATGLINLLSSFFRTSKESLGDYLAKLTSNPGLRTTLAYCFGDYGCQPKKGGLHLHAALWSHFAKGAFYPVGGSSEITMTMLNVMKSAGGKIFGGARVNEIIVDNNGQAVGVRVTAKPWKGHQNGEANGSVPATADIYAPIIVSGAGLVNTAKMLPPTVRQASTIPPALDIGVGMAAVNFFIGLNNSAEELGIENRNWWAFPYGKTLDTDEALAKLDKFSTLDEFIDSNEPFPLFFTSFPSIKDPLFKGRSFGKPMTTCTIVTLAPYEWFVRWEASKVKKRGDEYEALKKSIGSRIWDQLCSIMPKSFESVANIEVMDIGTPLTNNHYLGSTKGEIYGLDHTASRFRLEVANATRPDIGVKGLYISGQDLMTCGFAGAMMGGYICASEITGISLITDAIRMAKSG